MASAKNASSPPRAPTSGVLVATAQLHATELQAVLKQIIAHHPSSGRDAAKHAALGAVPAKLA
ncbi:hypothetical protein IVB57_09565 [Bradyrhizobium sp. CW9]|uniref:hypothetical protein n=1 Tax=Bradyrhizobium sp. CW9 TaxID=2782689 RepID=UPI001FFA3E4B|nr:hypothetical protein [Bradyrhizobium sp. CW9]MCK1328636.1 hypothetical protein [Bradyrhizobium sp. CW9]